MTAQPDVRALRPHAPRVALLGGEVDAVTSTDVIAFAGACVALGQGAVVANHNLHSLHLARHDAEMRAFYAAADLIEADSTPLIAWGRLLGRPIGREHRATYLDWREDFWRAAAVGGWRVFYLGGAPGVAARGAAAVTRRWPGVQIGVRDGYFAFDDKRVNDEILCDVREFSPNILFVGMGMPRQERWVLRHRQALPPCVIFTVGAAFDYEAGASKTPPRWTGRLGVEWLFRFFAEPRRLFSRYFLEPWTLIGPALADLRSR